jgi:hypothetical protein
LGTTTTTITNAITTTPACTTHTTPTFSTSVCIT